MALLGRQVLTDQPVPGWLQVVTVACFVTAAGLYWLRRPSRHSQWKALGAEFLRIAQADTPDRYENAKEKTYATLHFGRAGFGGGVHREHPALCDALSRTAGRLLRWSAADHPRRWAFIEPRGRWIQFAATYLSDSDPKLAREHVDIGMMGKPDQYLHVAVFPYAAYLACEYCASLERIPRP